MRCLTLVTCGLVVSSLELAAAAAPPFPPPPLSPFPALFFGANAYGAESSQQLAFEARHALAGYGWQQGTLATNFSHGEASLAQAAAALAGVAPTVPTFVYRHFQMAWDLFDVQRAADVDPALQGMFLRDNDNAPGARECRQPTPGNSTSPLYAFAGTNSGAFWVNHVIGEVAREPHVSGVFFDECDWSACGYSFAKDGCGNISNTFRAADLVAKYPALRATAEALIAAGKYPIFSAKNLLDAAFAGLPPTTPRPCVIPHDGFAAALRSVPHARFFEFWMGQGKEIDTATIADAVIEGSSGVGLVARAASDASSACPGQVCAAVASESSFTPPSLSYALAAFLVARTSPYSYFGVSSGWYSACWCWHAEYDDAAACGAPTGAAVRVSLFIWTRNYTSCDVHVDTASATGSFTRRAL